MPKLIRTSTRIFVQKGGGWVLFFLLFWASVCSAESQGPEKNYPASPANRSRSEVRKTPFNFKVNPLVRLKKSRFQVLAGRKEPNSAIYVNDQEVIPQNPYNTWYYEYPLSGNSTNITIGMAFVPRKQVAKASPKDATPLDVEPPVITGFRFDPQNKDFILTIKDPRGILAYNIYYANSLNPSGATSPFILAQSNYPVSGLGLGGITQWRDNGIYTKIHPADPSIKMRIYKLEVAIVDITPPPEPLVFDDGISTFNSTELRCLWLSTDTQSGPTVEYQYKISRDSPSGLVVVDWNSAGDSNSVTKSGLTLEAGKTYYFSVKAKNVVGLWSGIGFSDGITVVSSDTTPPTGSIKINNDAAYTKTASVTLNLSAQDNTGGSGLSQMRFSDNNMNWYIPENYAATKSWVLSSGNGVKTIYVKFSDAANNWSEPVSDTIILNTTPLSIVSVTEIEAVIGTVAAGSETISPSAVTVTNNTPGTKVNYFLSLVNPHGWTNSQAAAGVDTYILNAAFSNDAGKINWDNAKHALSTTPVVCSVSKFAGDQTGINVAYNDSRKLWFQFKAPTSTTASKEQGIIIRITAEISP